MPTYDFTVVGAGRMGASIAGHLVLQGARVALFDRSDFDRQKGYEIMRADMRSLEQRGLLLPADKDAALERITLVQNHEQCVQASVVVEAIFENLDAKRVLFAELDAAATRAGVDPVLSSNSINFSAAQITEGVTSESRHVCGLRFLYPVFFMRAIEGSSPSTRHLRPHVTLTASARGLSAAVSAMLSVVRPPEGQVAYVRQERDVVVECLICLNSSDNCLFAPCGHRNLCIPCGQKIRAQGRPCPTCRQPIERMLFADHDVPVPSAAPPEAATAGSLP